MTKIFNLQSFPLANMWLVSHSNNSHATVNNRPLELSRARTNSTECDSPTSARHHSCSPGASWKGLLMVVLRAKGQQTVLVTIPPTSPRLISLGCFSYRDAGTSGDKHRQLCAFQKVLSRKSSVTVRNRGNRISSSFSLRS